MGGRTQRGTRAASERGELVGGGAGGAAGADRACRPGGLQTARAPSRGRAAARLGPARARLERVRADRGGAVVRCGDRPATVRRPGQQREYPRRAPRPGTRARALCRDGTGAVGGASPGGSGGRGSGGGRPGGGRARGRAGPAAAASGRSLSRVGERVAARCPRGFCPRRAVLAACGWTSGNGGWRGGRPGRYPAAGGPDCGPAGHRTAADGAHLVRGGGGDAREERGRARGRARVGAAAAPSAEARRGDRPPRAPDPRISGERGRARGTPGAGARERGDSEVMRRRDFVKTVGRFGGSAVSADLLGRYPSTRLPVYPSLLLPMDDAQSDHLKAYGVTYRIIRAGIKAEWLLNYRGGAFLVPDGDAVRRDAALGGVKVEPVDDGRGTGIRAESEARNMDAVPLEKAPKVAVDGPAHAPPRA